MLKSLRDNSRTWKLTLVLAMFWLAVSSGCATATPLPKGTPLEYNPALPEQLFPQGQPLVYPGRRDDGDKHLSSVMVMVGSGEAFGKCSGVLIHERLVITAGHCVCAKRAPLAGDKVPAAPVRGAGAYMRASALQGVELTSVMDARGLCSGSANIVSASYAGSQPQAEKEGSAKPLRGEVSVHPRFELVFGKRGREEAPHVFWSNADLAAIFLEQPVPFRVPALELADTEVQVGELITIIGFGSGSTFFDYGIRHYGENQVSRLISLETGSTIFRAEAMHLPDGTTASYARGGDSGGACIIKKGTRNVLVGITTIGARTSSGEAMSIFTSVYSHRSWLLQMLRKVQKT